MWKKKSTQQYTWYVSICAKRKRIYNNDLYMQTLEDYTKILIKTDCEGNGWLGDRDNVPLYMLSTMWVRSRNHFISS